MCLVPTLPSESLRHSLLSQSTALHSGKDFARFTLRLRSGQAPRKSKTRLCSHLSPRPRGVWELPTTCPFLFFNKIGECSDFPLSKSDCLTPFDYITKLCLSKAEHFAWRSTLAKHNREYTLCFAEAERFARGSRRARLGLGTGSLAFARSAVRISPYFRHQLSPRHARLYLLLRRRRDSNSRTGFPIATFPTWCTRPLCDASVA